MRACGRFFAQPQVVIGRWRTELRQLACRHAASQSCSYEYLPGSTMRVEAAQPGSLPLMTPVPLSDKLNTILVHLPPAP
jgi:hypothetical protein